MKYKHQMLFLLQENELSPLNQQDNRISTWKIIPGRRLRNPYTLVNDRTRSVFLRIRPYFVVLHGPVLRSYISVPVYGAIRSYTEQNGDRIWPPCTETANDRFFLRISPYFSVYDTEINGRNTGPCKSSYFSVYAGLPDLPNLAENFRIS
jgi:hypothetical protein